MPTDHGCLVIQFPSRVEADGFLGVGVGGGKVKWCDMSVPEGLSEHLDPLVLEPFRFSQPVEVAVDGKADDDSEHGNNDRDEPPVPPLLLVFLCCASCSRRYDNN